MATLHETEFLEALNRITPQWLAGFFDGEGCISCVRHRGMPALRVDLIQCDYNILHLIGLKFGREPYTKPGRSKKHRTGYVLGFVGKSALPFLQYIQPHVVLKRKLVEWGIEMAKLHGEPGGNRRRGKGFLKPEVRQRREELLETIKAENQSGRLPKPN
jgi:hypothetical protein